MADPLRLRVHVSEPFDFERENPSNDVFGWTLDDDGENEEWEIALDGIYTFNETNYDRMLVSPRYVGEHLDKVHDALLGVAVRIAHRVEPDEDEEGEGWHFAMTGMIGLAPPPPPSPPPPPLGNEDDPGSPGQDDTTGS